MQGGKYVVQKRETKAINKLCVREILSLSFVCGAYFFEFRGRNLVCFGIAYNFDWGRHMQIRAGSREGTHAHCVFHACRRDTQKLRNSSVLYHKTKNPFEAKICMKISFQLL